MTKFRIAVISVTPFHQNCSLVFDEDTKRAAVVDPGGDVARIEEAIAQTGVKVEKILLTHGHLDHAGGAEELKEKLGVRIEGPHKDDKYLLDAVADRGRDFGVSDMRNCRPDAWLEDGDVVEAAGFTFKVIHAPGHSPGSVVFFNEENRFALMGDVLFRGSVGRTDLPRGDHATLIKSIKSKILPLGDDVSFLPGHGQPSQIGVERQTNPFLTD
jgi:glyoxylase-like metal-dependent hydrolase (beta-lactamase superfamily II)